MIRIFITETGNGYKEQHEAAYKLLFDGIKQLWGISASEEDILKGGRGKPYFREGIPVSFGISHCKGYAACAVCAAGYGDIGFDMECIREYRERTADKVFSPEEHEHILESDNTDLAYTVMWTLKESYVKYTGTGLSGHFSDVHFRLSEEGICSDSELHFFSLYKDMPIITLCSEKPLGYENVEILFV